MKKKKLLFIESNTTGTGMLALTKAYELGYEPILITHRPERYEGLPQANCRVILADTNSLDAVRACVLREQPELIAGMTTTSDFYLETAAALAEEFGWSGNGVHAVAACRNKAVFRESMQSASLLQPQHTVIRSMEELERQRGTLRIPCVVKPADDTGSTNVRFCTTWEEMESLAGIILAKECNARGQRTAQTVLIEEFVDGPEFSVEMFSWQGEAVCIGITEKRLTGFPFFVESGHVFPAVMEEGMREAIERTVRSALQTVDFKYGPSHSEVKWTSDGCVLIEVNPRLAGGMIPELIFQSTGIDLLKQQILCAAGHAPQWERIDYQAYAGIQFITVSKSGIYVDTRGMEYVMKLPGVVDVTLKATAGQSVSVPENFSHRLGHVLVCCPAYEEAAACMERASSMLEIQVHELSGEYTSAIGG
jgi:S-sulfo-L-cysteine synthase (3-phospho-L-serine-dependent)